MIKRLFQKIFGTRDPDKLSGRARPVKAETAGSAARPAHSPGQAALHPSPVVRRPVRKGRSASRKNKSGEPTIVQAGEHGIDPKLVSANAMRVTKTLQDSGFEAFVVGGAVRDLLLGIKPKDFDVATNATPDQIVPLFRRARLIGRRFQIVHVMFGSDTIEVSTFRANQPHNAEKDEHGRVLRDNVFGSQLDDAARRDFTVNALFYDPNTQVVIDYHQGVADVNAKTMRIIGDPEQRYREDPVRMLRAVRFAAKLGFEIDDATRTPIAGLATLMANVPSSRLFDEMLKLFMSGNALACLQRLRAEGLHHGLLPLLDVVLEQPMGERFVTLALQSTDERIRLGKPASPSFLFACLLWHEVLKAAEENRLRGDFPIPALNAAMESVLEAQTVKLAIQRRFSSDMREIWGLQPRFERRTGRSPYRLFEHMRFRAAYDFLLLRCEAGEADAALGDWWTRFIEADSAEREGLQAEPSEAGAAGTSILSRSEAPKRKRRRRKTTSASANVKDATDSAESENADDSDVDALAEARSR